VESKTERGKRLFEVEANVLLDGEKVSIGKFTCCTDSGIDMNILFTELLRKK